MREIHHWQTIKSSTPDELRSFMRKIDHWKTMKTRTTRTPAFWRYPRRLMITHTIESYLIPSQKKTKSKLQIYITHQNFWILKQPLYRTHLLKLLDKMCKYEMDPMSIVEDTERTRFCPQTDRRTDGQGEISIPPFQLRWSGRYNNAAAYHVIMDIGIIQQQQTNI